MEGKDLSETLHRNNVSDISSKMIRGKKAYRIIRKKEHIKGVIMVSYVECLL